MLDLELSGSERRAFHELLNGSWRATTEIEVLDSDDETIATIEQRLISGSVSVTAEAPTRRADFTFVNSGRRFKFVPGGIGQASLYANNEVRITRIYEVPELDRRVHVPLFCGPIKTCEPNERTVHVTTVGREALALDPAFAWRSQSFGRKTKVTDAIRAIMRAQGERRFDIPDLDYTLRHPVSVGRKSQAWKVCRRLADSIDRQLFYDARGKLRLRHVPTRAVWTFIHGEPNANVTSPVTPTYSLEDLRNTIECLGPNPEGPKKRLRYVATPLAGHPLSPQSLGRNGEPLYLVTSIDMPHAKELEQLRNRAERELEDALRAAVTVTFEARQVPHLEIGDVVAIRSDGERTAFRLKEFTVPMMSGPMSVNFLRRPKSRRGAA